jgi:selenocysteine lyase/cysteine desulfurase
MRAFSIYSHTVGGDEGFLFTAHSEPFSERSGMKFENQLSRRLFIAGAASAIVGSAVVQTASAQESAPSVLASTGKPDEAYWKNIREGFSLNNNFTFLNNGTLGPAPNAVVAVRRRYEEELAADPTNSFRPEELAGVRKRVAEFAGADADEIALTHSTTEGMNIFAKGLRWQPEDEVIIGAWEHFSPIEAYQALEKQKGIKIIRAEEPALPKSVDEVLAAYEKKITAKTRLIVISHVTYVTGLLTPIKELAELAHHKGILISVDGAQSTGVIPLDFHASGVDHYASPGQKWLLAGTGTGFTYIKKALQDKVEPLFGYYDPDAVRNRAAAKPKPGGQDGGSATRYEKSGQLNIPALCGISAAVDLQLSIGKENIAARARQLSAQLRDGLREIPGVRLWSSDDLRFHAGITAFSVGNLPQDKLVRALQKQEQIIVRSINHGEVSGLRVSTHFYNTPDEVARLLAALRKLVGKKDWLES